MTGPAEKTSDVVSVSLEEEMKSSYLDYAMSVIVSRALPDVRDGLKPVHRRILFAMHEAGFDAGKPYKKSARVTGEVMGKYHPHGNDPIYGAMVRMAQDFSMRLPLIDGQGNFGSMDGDAAAAERYTEARLAKSAHALLEDIDKETVDFRPNYDGTIEEPTVLPARYPNILVNGAGGIAVGMATNIPTHNLGEVVDACCAYLDNADITIDEMMQYVKGPDFPTGGIILGHGGIISAFRTGRGSIIIRGKTHVEEIRKDREAIIITEVPYQVVKARMLERMAEVVKEKIIEGISDLRDESDRDGVRVVIELKRDAVAEVVLNQLYRHSPLQTSFGVNMLALDRGQPKTMNLKQMIEAFIAFRREVITRRVRFELSKARERAHVLLGLAVAVANIDEMIALIKAAADPQVAREKMMARGWLAADIAPLVELVAEPGPGVVNGEYRLSEVQARAILDLRLHRLTGLERDRISNELNELIEQIKEFLAILASREKIDAILRQELLAVKEQFATPRLTQIEESSADIDLEDLIQKEDMIVTVSQNGYIKRVPLSTYRAQRRGGKGRSGMSTREEDVVTTVFVANTHTPLLFFSSRGICYSMKVYALPMGSPQSLGKAVINLLPLEAGETISTIMPMPDDPTQWEKMSIVFSTSMGTIRRNALSDFTNVKSNGKIAMKLEADERLIGVEACTLEDDVLLATRAGKCIRFRVSDLRQFTGRTSTGVRAIKLAAKDEVISLSILKHVDFTTDERAMYLKMKRGNTEQLEGEESTGSLQTLSQERYSELEAMEQFILSVTDKGFGKRSSAYEYRITNRGGQGIANMVLTEKNGQIVASFIVEHTDQIVLVTDAGKLLRCPVSGIRIAGRSTQGVTLFNVSDAEKVVSVARVPEDENGDNGDGADESEGEALEGSAEEAAVVIESDSPHDSDA
ncbi:DNA gyrase subunit A [Candidatus Nucleicultrix amoebiphila]|uniref:DNA gyrase subunit A n=1 Tax=Candidatus Nucleicultrix amoebiphila FS5 TaxID=1414854 RepID=A0A1W6N3J8_9PROT|nr:DNA gyrase subunit A [Candidatus Nucleicultrix amoebiphila]ARN84331.1 DNA gyrase subunit A [Candidatus Nucleicultrix amoebiphila FS5]